MAYNRRHGHLAAAPWGWKLVVEIIILDEFVLAVTLWGVGVSGGAGGGIGGRKERPTVVDCPPARWPATARAMDGFSATHSILLVIRGRRMVAVGEHRSALGVRGI